MIKNIRDISSSQKVWISLFLFVSALAIVLHLWRLDSLPAGLYVDETSIGLNAAAIASNLHDEHQQFLPVFFAAFGEYKNPVYIYLTAANFSLFGVSPFTLRLTSVIFFLIFATGVVCLAKKIYPTQPLIWLYALITASSLPWFFTLSRISFEVISQPAILIWAVYFIWNTYQDRPSSHWRYHAIVAGLLLGLSTYTYTTSRLLSFATVITLILVYKSKTYWLKHLHLILSFILTLIPYAYFSLANPGALTARIRLISFLYDPQLTIADKINQTIANYFTYFDPTFLLLQGDTNLRHHTGFGGQLFVTVAILAVIGTIAIASAKKVTTSTQYSHFGWFILLNAAIAPLAAATTQPGHALRSLLFGFFIFILSLYGLNAITHLSHTYHRNIALTMVIVLTLFQASQYLVSYFTDYAAKTSWAFEDDGFHQALAQAIQLHPQSITVTSLGNATYAPASFYQYIVANPTHIPILVQYPQAQPNTCLITTSFDTTIANPSNLPPTTHQDYPFAQLNCY